MACQRAHRGTQQGLSLYTVRQKTPLARPVRCFRVFAGFDDSINSINDVEVSKYTAYTSRRNILALVLGVSSLVYPVAQACAATQDSFLYPEEKKTIEALLPRDFVDTAYDLIDALKESIEVDLSGAPEREVRRKAEPAKDLVKRYINTWSGASAIADTTACKEIRLAVQELGEFYRVQGQRKRMSKEVADSILNHLSVAESALPEKKEKSIFPF